MLVSYEDAMRSYEGDAADAPRALTERRLQEAENLLFGVCAHARRRAETPAGRALVEDIITRAVLRLVRDSSPGYKSETEGNYSYEKDPLTSSGNLWFPEADLAALGCGKAPRAAVGTIRVSANPTFANTRPRRRNVARPAGGWL